MADVVLTETDAGRTIAVSPGDIVTLRLGENASTGYTWSIAAQRGVTILHEEHVQAPDAMVGGGGTKFVRLLVTGAGTSVVKAVLARPWDPPDRVAEQLVFVLDAAAP